MTLGEKIKLLRKEKDLTQPELAEQAGIEQSYLSKLENDKGSPSWDIISRIAMALGLAPMELINALSTSYVERNLAHIPEVATEYASIRLKQESSLRKHYGATALGTILSLGVFLTGHFSLLFPEEAYSYLSANIITEGESQGHSAIAPVFDINVETDAFLTYDYLGRQYVSRTEDGTRFYTMTDRTTIERRENDLLKMIGILTLGASLLAGLIAFRFRPGKTF